MNTATNVVGIDTAANTKANVALSQPNVVDPSEYSSEILAELERQGAFYDVQLLENYWYDTDGITGEYKTTGKRTVVNMDKKEVIGTVSSKYVPVLNEDIFTKFDNVLINCENINLTGAKVKVQTNGNGARIMVEYILPAHTVTLANGDECALSITALNSFDGSTGFKVFCGGIRFKCMNGMVLGDMMATYQKKHCAGLSIEAAAQVIETGLTAYLNGVDTWNEQINAEVSPETVWKCLAEFAGIKDYEQYPTRKAYDEQRTNRNADGSPRKLIIDSYYDIAKKYVRELGQTEWALNNALTHIATHGLREEKPSIQSQINKAEKAAKLIGKYLNKGQ